jgi:sortase A
MADMDARPRLTSRAGRDRTVRRITRLLGVGLLACGLVLLASVAWQLWGTGIITARDQHRLGQQFERVVRAAAHPSADVVTSPAPSIPPARTGTVIAHLVIPTIGISNYVVEGVGSAQLAEGTGHYPGTAAIGGEGNVGIAGHRTTYGHPFYNLNELQPGDPIYLTNLADRTFTYRVTTQFVVSPSDTAVLDPTPTPTLTLTTCNPRYSASQRLIVQAALVKATIPGVR